MNTITIAAKQPVKRTKPMHVIWGAWVKECRYDEKQHTWDFIGIYNEIKKKNKADFPFVTDLQLVVFYEASLSESGKSFNLTLEILDPDKPIFSITEELILPETMDRSIQWYEDYKIEDVIIREPGDYLLYILVDNQEKQTIPLHVIVPKRTIYDSVNDVTTELWPEDYERLKGKPL